LKNDQGECADSGRIRLAAVCRELDGRGVRWAVSNSDTEFIKTLFHGFRTVAVANRREINLNSQDRGISELLIMNYRERMRALRLVPGFLAELWADFRMTPSSR
jgi:site-specific DNA-adenine methylase